ncbi:hypothetical protein SEA_ZOOMAN_239 [Microbacterium phage Zooman]|nr:hypothetical protein SEA_ZOOMAN_239 [Microbacterium phage Zooman]
MEITIHGSSDDLVDVLVDGEYVEEFDCPGKWAGKVYNDEGESLIVTAVFGSTKKGRKADWTLGVENTASWPQGWSIRFGERPDREGDPAIIITVPEGAKVREL